MLSRSRQQVFSIASGSAPTTRAQSTPSRFILRPRSWTGKNTLYSDDAHYELQADDTLTKAVENRTWLILVAINRVTGSYEISDGPAIVQQVKTETGTCTKMDRKL
jgi:hypothetical protein